jgi:hypothetical protein
MRYDQADHQWSPRVVGGSAARICPIWATHSLQIHTATIAEVLGSMVLASTDVVYEGSEVPQR